MRAWTEDEFRHLLWYLTSEPRPQGNLERSFGPLHESPLGQTSAFHATPALDSGEAAGYAHFDAGVPSASPLTGGFASLGPPSTVLGLGPGVGLAAQYEEASVASLPSTAVPCTTSSVGGGDGVPPASDSSAPAVQPQEQQAQAQAMTQPEVPNRLVKLDLLISYLEEEVMEKELQQRALAVPTMPLPGADPAVASEGSPLVGHGLVGQAALDAYVSELVTFLRDFPYERLEGGREAGAWVRDDVVAPNFRGRWDFYSNKKQGAGFDLAALEHTLCGENMLLDRLRYSRLKAGI